MIVVFIWKHVHLLGIMKQAVTFTPPLGWLIDHDRVYIGYNVPNGLISCRIFI